MDYRLTSLILALGAAALIFRLVRGNLLHAAYASWWLGGAAVIFLAGTLPELVDYVGHALGVSYPPTFFLVLAAVALALRMLAADIARTRMELTMRILARRNAEQSLELKRLAGRLRSEAAARGSGQSPPPGA
jgi:hypothetical protein